jgi:hypothetical protein
LLSRINGEFAVLSANPEAVPFVNGGTFRRQSKTNFKRKEKSSLAIHLRYFLSQMLQGPEDSLSRTTTTTT